MFGAVVLSLFLLVLVADLIWAISRILRALAVQHPSLSKAINEWAFSVRLSTLFYALLIVATLKLVNLSDIKPEAQLEFKLGIIKDYLLLFIIAGMLFTGLFKIGSARSLKALFQTRRGCLHFILLCGVVAVLAIWADFNAMSPECQDRIFKYEWQKQVNRLRVYVRDIDLILVPIASLLLRSLGRIAEEIAGEPKVTH